MTSNRTRFRVPWAALMMVGLGVLFVALGVWRFAARSSSAGYDALLSLAAFVPAALLLLVFDYVLHHAPLAAILLLMLAAALHHASPAWDVALGAALVAAIAVPAIRERRDASASGKNQSYPHGPAKEAGRASEEGQ
jgi:glucan phosphoethanolaminetransferase (alkaline phosphatase superfamily)